MKWNATKKAEFLDALRAGDSIVGASSSIGYRPSSLYKRRWIDEQFDKEWEEALREGEKVKVALLEGEADRRAIEGYLKPVYYNGVAVGAERRYSDTLLMFRLNGLAPEKYRQRHELAVQGEININVVEQYRDAMKQAEDLRGKVIDLKPNGGGNGHANGNGKAHV